ncbi:MAG: hypothetical protein ACFCU9_02270 [Cyanophyceae cyanobacterium]
MTIPRLSDHRLQVAANLYGWGHWTRILALAVHLPQVQFQVYNTMMPKLPQPHWIPNVERVSTLETGMPLICDYSWQSALPYQPSDFPKSLCIRRHTPGESWDPRPFSQTLLAADLNRPGHFPPVVLETPIVNKPFDSHIVVSSEQSNHHFLAQLYPTYSHRVVFPVTSFRQQIQHLVGIAGYNLFWECAYYGIPCTLHRATHVNDSHHRLDELGDRPMPDPFVNGAPALAQALYDWWIHNL